MKKIKKDLKNQGVSTKSKPKNVTFSQI